MTAAPITTDFVSKLTALKQDRFSGYLLLKGLAGQEWNICLFLGRILYASGGNHPVRRWLRQLKSHCPQVDIHQLKLSSILSKQSAESFCSYWEYQFLYSGVEQQQITREQAVKMIGALVVEVLFDAVQALHVNYQVKPENLAMPQLVLLDPGQVITEVQQVWQTWQKAKIADYSPNRAPIINQPEKLQQQVSAGVYQNLTKLLDGQRTLRDLSVAMNRDVKEVTCSLLPYIQAGLVELIDIPDLAAPVTSSSPPATPQPTTASSKGPLIACVDDSPLVCQSLEQILTTGGYQFLAIQDSLRAIASLLTSKPDLIFLDLVMPNTNGYEICGQLRKVSMFRNTPIIILTGNDGIIDRVRAKIVGASDFLSKPVDAETVLDVVNKHLNSTAPVE